MAGWITRFGQKDLTFYVGQVMPEVDFHDVIEVQVDGHELGYVKTHFKNLPEAPPHCRFVRYFGDHAKFIVAHWKQK